MKDTLIIEHLRKGDEAAFKYIYECHYVLYLLCHYAHARPELSGCLV